MADYDLSSITTDTDGPAADTEVLFGSPAAGTPKPYSFAGVKTWVKSWIAKGDVGLGNVANATPHPGYTASRRYFFTSQGSTSATGNTLTAGRIYLKPVYVPVAITLSTLIANLKTAVGSSNVQFGIYAQDPTVPHRPGDLMGSTGSSSSASANTNIEIALSANAELAAGWYFVGVNSDTNGVAFSAVATTGWDINQFSGADSLANLFSATTNSHSLGFYTASSFNTWPASLNGATFVEEAGTNRVPLFGFIAASVP